MQPDGSSRSPGCGFSALRLRLKTASVSDRTRAADVIKSLPQAGLDTAVFKACKLVPLVGISTPARHIRRSQK